MFGALKRWIAKTEEVKAVVISRLRSDDGQRYTITCKEVDGERTFTKTFDWCGPSGHSAPKPHTGSTVILHINRLRKVVYGGDL